MSTTAFGEPCRKCGKAPLFRFVTDGNGHHKEELVEGCVHARKLIGLCRRCPNPLVNVSRNAVYCGPVCAREGRLEHEREYQRKYRAKNLGTVRDRDANYRRRKRAKDPEGEREKEYKRAPKYRERQRALKRAQRRWGHPMYEKQLARRRDYYRRNKETILGRQRAARARKRAEREAARAARIAA